MKDSVFALDANIFIEAHRRWFTFRTQAGESTMDEVADFLTELT